jgi:hypothetical protein
VGNSSLTLALIYCLVIGALIVSSFIDLELSSFRFHYPGRDRSRLRSSFFFPQIHWTDRSNSPCKRVFLGILVGGGILYAISRLGKHALDATATRLKPMRKSSSPKRRWKLLRKKSPTPKSFIAPPTESLSRPPRWSSPW